MSINVNTPRLYLVTDTEMCGGPRGLVETVRAAASAGVDVVQLRDHQATTRELATMATELIDVCTPLGLPVVIDDRLDVALAVGAAGVHLGQSDLDPTAARRLAMSCVGPEFHIGWSTSTVAQVDAARALGPGVVDLLGIGPYRATATKPDAAAPLGLDGAREVLDTARGTGLDTVVIGGVKTSDVADLLAAGAAGVAVVSAICGQPDPEQATRALRRAIDAALAEHGMTEVTA